MQAAIEQVLPAAIRERLGVDSSRAIMNALIALTAFAPAPATFDIEALTAVAQLSPAQGDDLAAALYEMGVLRRTSPRRYEIADQAVVELALRIHRENAHVEQGDGS